MGETFLAAGLWEPGAEGVRDAEALPGFDYCAVKTLIFWVTECKGGTFFEGDGAVAGR